LATLSFGGMNYDPGCLNCRHCELKFGGSDGALMCGLSIAPRRELVVDDRVASDYFSGQLLGVCQTRDALPARGNSASALAAANAGEIW